MTETNEAEVVKEVIDQKPEKPKTEARAKGDPVGDVVAYCKSVGRTLTKEEFAKLKGQSTATEDKAEELKALGEAQRAENAKFHKLFQKGRGI